MPAYTYQVAIRDHGEWFREYVCAEDKYNAIYRFLDENPSFTIDSLLSSEFEVERCE